MKLRLLPIVWAVLIFAIALLASSLLICVANGQQLFKEITIQQDIVFTSYTPSPTTNKLYMVGSALYFNGAAISPAGSPVTSVALTMPPGFTVGGSPVTGAGTLTVTSAISGLVKVTAGTWSAATADVDYSAVHTTLAGYGITNGVPTSRTINTHSLGSNLVLTSADIGSEPALGNPVADAYLLSSTMLGVRSWIPAPATGVTSVAAGTGLTGGPITTTGTLSVTGHLLTMANLADAAGWLHSTGANVYAWSVPSATDVGLGNVTNVAQAAAGAVGSSGLTMSTGYLLGRNTAATGAIEQITLGTGLSFSGTTLNASGAVANPTATLSNNTAVNGTATSAIRSDGAFAISTSAVFQFARLGLGAAADGTLPLWVSSGANASMKSVITTGVNIIMQATSNTGYASFRLYNDQNSSGRALEIGYAGSSYSGSIITGSPTGEAAYITSTGAYGLYFGTANTYRMGFSSTGIMAIANTTDATNTTTGSVTLAGGLAVAKTVWANILDIAATTDATTLATGSIITSGGMGVAKTIWANALHLPSSGFAMRDTSAAYDLTVASTSSTAFTAGRTLTLDLVNAARTLKIQGSPTLDDWFDQSVKSGASPTHVALTLSGATASTVLYSNASKAITSLANGTGWLHDDNAGTFAWSTPLSTDIVIPGGIGSPSSSTVQDWFNNIGSSGRLSGGAVTNHGDGSVDISEMQGVIFTTDTLSGPVKFFKKAASNLAGLTDLAVNYLYISYDSGNLTYHATTDRTTIHEWDMFVIGRAYRGGTTCEYSATGINVINEYRRAHDRLILKYGGMDWVSGAALSQPTALHVAITAGSWYSGNIAYTTAGVDTSGAGRLSTFWRSGASAWTETSSLATLPVTQYNRLSDNTLQNLMNNHYGVYWMFTDPINDLYAVYGQVDYAKLADAQAAIVPSALPPEMNGWARLVGRIIFQKSAASFQEIDSVFAQNFTLSVVQDHNDLGGLQGGTTAEYYHLSSAAYTNISAGTTSTPQFSRLGAGAAADGAAAIQAYGTGTSPAVSGTTTTGIFRMKASTNSVIDMGGVTAANGAWMQVYDSTNLAVTYNLFLQPVGGNVGIGVTAPPVRGTILSAQSLTTGDLMFTYNAAGQYRNSIANFFASSDAPNNDMVFRICDGTTTGQVSVMTLTGAGNVGIGTVAPSGFRLYVANDALALDNLGYLLRVGAGPVTGLGPVRFQFGVYPATVGGNRYGQITVGDDSDWRNLVLQPSGGNVGIGTSSPSYRLQVQLAADDRLMINQTAANNFGIQLAYNSTRVWDLYCSGSATADLYFYNQTFGLVTTFTHTGGVTFSSSLTTGAPAGGTAAPFRVGIYHVGPPTVTGYIEMDINGVLYKVLTTL